MDRKRFLKQTGHLLIGFNLLPFAFCSPRTSPSQNSSISAGLSRTLGDRKAVDSWIRLDSDGMVTLFTGKMELGQGIRTALKQIAAEELDVAIQRVQIIIADTQQTPDERFTAGSASIVGSGMAIRYAAAEARKQLLEMAAQLLGLPIESLRVEDGIIGNGNKQISYWQLLQGKRLQGEVSGKAPIKNPEDYRLVGKAEPREDIMAMAVGRPFYVQDMRLPNMLHARILRPPSYGAKLLAYPETEIRQMNGIVDIFQSGSFLAVLAKEEFTAVKAWRLLREHSTWQAKKLSPLQNELFDDMRNFAGKSRTVEDRSTGKPITYTHEATYTRPYQMHASIGPSFAIAQWENELLTVWTHSQGVFPLRATLSNLLALPEEQIRVAGIPGSGCYGHNGADDAAADAAILAYNTPNTPIRVQWMREDEHQWEPYGSAMTIQLKAGLNEKGRISSWQCDLWSDTHSTRPNGQASYLLPAQYMEPAIPMPQGDISGGSYRNAIPYYSIGDLSIRAHEYKGPLRTSALRSLGAYANIFALESFMDELAHQAQVDPLAFRLQHLTDPRATEVLNAVATRTNWNDRTNLPSHVALGLAFAKYKNEASYFAVVARVVLDREKRQFSIEKLTSAIDAGQTINPDGLKNQTEGGLIQSASWSLLEQVNYNEDGVTSATWETYPIMRFSEVPDTEVIIIDRPQEAPLGAGEAAQGPTVAAIANALYAATGTRIRTLPFTANKINWDKI